jgi:hypothetical protein
VRHIPGAIIPGTDRLSASARASFDVFGFGLLSAQCVGRLAGYGEWKELSGGCSNRALVDAATAFLRGPACPERDAGVWLAEPGRP